MKIDRLFAVTIVLVSAVLAGCGSSDDSSSTDGSTGSGTGTSDVACTYSTAGTMSCTSYSNLSSAQADSVKQICSSESGTEADSCPTDNILGCCSQTLGGFDTDTCYYQSTGATADAYKMACESGGGTWSDTP